LSITLSIRLPRCDSACANELHLEPKGGRGGTLDKWEIHYIAAMEIFEGTLTIVNDEP
jgi:hypothetical protein